MGALKTTEIYVNYTSIKNYLKIYLKKKKPNPEMYSLTVLKSTNLESRCQETHAGSSKG